ncbi:epigen, partial [Silurus meridionalis]
DEPRVLPMLKLCSGQHESFCINGLCSFHENINTPSCTCHSGFIGERCEIFNPGLPVTSPFKLEEVISISCGVIVLLVCVCALSYCCYRKW